MIALNGPQDAPRMEARAPTFSFTMKGWRPRRVAEKLSDQGIDLSDGNYYALAVTERLGLEDKDGMVRAGAAHYNAGTEIAQFGQALERQAGA